jgi:hypothetical protein
MKSEIKVYCILLLMGMSCLCWGDFKVTKTCDSVVDAKALVLGRSHPEFGGQGINAVHCQQDAMVTHKNHQYVAYYDANRRVSIARRKLPAGQWSIIHFTDYFFENNDDHNTICMGVCPGDGTIHLTFDHHIDSLHYRVSRKGVASHPETIKWEASLFGPIVSELEKGRTLIGLTYPRFWQTPEGNLQLCYRVGSSGGGDRMLVDYDAATSTWINTRQIDSGKGEFQDTFNKSPSRCSYPNGYDYGPFGRLHVTWVWRERTQGANHGIMYAYSEDRGKTWLNNQGKVLAEPPHIGSPGIKVVDISRAYSLINSQSQAVDSKGRIHTVMWHTTDETLEAAKTKPGKSQECWGPPDARRYHHYWRDKNGTWQHTELPWVAGNIPKLFMDKNDNAYLIYGGAKQGTLMKLHNVDHNLTIAAATANSNWTDWEIIHVEKGPFFSDMLGDLYRWKKEGVLSVIVQDSPRQQHGPNYSYQKVVRPGETPQQGDEPTPLRILDFSLAYE